jgi:uncharacterized glyoxalase superfamily protein PhnB
VIVPVLRYPDTDAGLRFLVDGLGFELVGDPERNDDGVIVHAELRRGDAWVMLSNADGPKPAEAYLVDDDPDGLFQRALAAGADTIYPPKDQPYDSREFAVEDPGGTTWYVGTYAPSD